MTDIVERLRICAKYDPDQAEAADLIEQFRVDLNEYELDLNRFQRALRIAAGLISTMNGYSDRHPEHVYDWLLEEGSVNE